METRGKKMVLACLGQQKNLGLSEEDSEQGSFSDIDDTDDDPNYDPEEELIKKRMGDTPFSSPLRDEQRKTAAEIEELMGDWIEDREDAVYPPLQDLATEEETLQDLIPINNRVPEINIAAAAKPKGKGKAKKNYCQYCDTFKYKMSRHFTTVHKNVPEIKAYMSLVAENKKKLIIKKREVCRQLINNSNKIYNNKHATDKSQLITTKKTKIEVTQLSHVECSGCGALTTRKYFYSHKNYCQKRHALLSKDVSQDQPTGSLLFSALDKKYDVLAEKVFPFMKKDEITLRAHSDSLILEYGRRFLKGHRAQHQRNYVSNRMRSLANIVITMKTFEPSINSLEDCLDSENFNHLCEAVKTWSKYSEDTGDCEVGSVPRRLCSMLKECAKITVSMAIRANTLTKEEKDNIQMKSDRFLHLMNSDWAMELNSFGDSKLRKNRNNNEDKVPESDDVLKFCEHMKEKITQQTHSLKISPNKTNYTTLTQSLLVFLTVFNGRRPSEVTWATVENYNSTLEKSSSKTCETDSNLAVFKVTAPKNGLRVPILMPTFAEVAVATLVSCRQMYNLKGDYLFSKLDGTAYNTSDLISKVKLNLKLKKTE